MIVVYRAVMDARLTPIRTESLVRMSQEPPKWKYDATLPSHI